MSPFQEAVGDAGDGSRTLTSSCKLWPIQLVTVDSNKGLQSGLGLLLGRAEQTAALGGVFKQPTPQQMGLSDSTLWEENKNKNKNPSCFTLRWKQGDGHKQNRLKWERGVWRFIWVALTIAVKAHQLSWGTLGENSETRAWGWCPGKVCLFWPGCPWPRPMRS